MRRHGWELPYHPLQVVAIAVFLALAFAFYVFLAPFLGSRLMELISLVLYSALMVSVFGLYIWCAALNPADPAVSMPKKDVGSFSPRISTSCGISTRAGDQIETSTEPSSFAMPLSVQSRSSKGLAAGDHKVILQSPFFCCLDSKRESQRPETGSQEDKLYCSLCEVEIYTSSKHCRVCDKCIDGFDHHCRWLNNCVGKKNYKIFIALLIFGICLLVMEWAIGVWVIARCFMNRNQFEEEVFSRLGSCFSLAAFLSVVVVSTLLATFATFPLGQLCLFHALLIQKGISTYDYIIAMREQNQCYGVDFPSPYASPQSSVATAMSGASSVGALHNHSWCTPPRLLVDHEQTPIQFDDFKHNSCEALKRVSVENRIKTKFHAKISPWALAKLNSEDAIRAASEARRHSSVLQSIPHKEASRAVVAETDSYSDTSSDEVARNILAATLNMDRSSSMKVNPESTVQQTRERPWHGEMARVPVMLGGDACGFIEKGGMSIEPGAVPLPLQLEASKAFCRRGGDEMFPNGSSSVSTSTESSKGSPEVSAFCGVSPSSMPSALHPVMKRNLALHDTDGSAHLHGCTCDKDEAGNALTTPSKQPSRGAQFVTPERVGYEASADERANDSSDLH